MKRALSAFAAVGLSFLSSAALAIAPGKSHPKYDFPENNLWMQDCIDCEDVKMTEAQFLAIVKSVSDVYAPIVKGLGGNLVMVNAWTDPTVNAYAVKSGNDWEIHMFGGLARRPEVTADGFASVVCHELGHHLSGFPFYAGSDMAAEGGADWFATGACAKKVWGNKLKENSDASLPASSGYKKWCADKGGDLCVRELLAGQSLANLLAKLNGEPVPSYQTPDKTVVREIYEGHPKAQARLDTYLAGVVCQKGFPVAYRPGLPADGIGYNTKAAEAAAKKASCANYPLSWYASPKQ